MVGGLKEWTDEDVKSNKGGANEDQSVREKRMPKTEQKRKRSDSDEEDEALKREDV